jgi:hypothetical protein
MNSPDALGGTRLEHYAMQVAAVAGEMQIEPLGVLRNFRRKSKGGPDPASDKSLPSQAARDRMMLKARAVDGCTLPALAHVVCRRERAIQTAPQQCEQTRNTAVTATSQREGHRIGRAHGSIRRMLRVARCIFFGRRLSHVTLSLQVAAAMRCMVSVARCMHRLRGCICMHECIVAGCIASQVLLKNPSRTLPPQLLPFLTDHKFLDGTIEVCESCASVAASRQPRREYPLVYPPKPSCTARQRMPSALTVGAPFTPTRAVRTHARN